MTIRKRLLATAGAVALTLAIAVTAVAAGGPLRGLAAQDEGAARGNAISAANTANVATIDPAAFGLDLADLALLAAPGIGGDPQARCQAFVTGLATNLNVTADQLQAALKQTLLQQIDAALAAGTLTADQAQAARDRVNNATGGLCANLGGLAGHVGGGKSGIGGGRGMGGSFLQGEVVNAAAASLGISADQFKQDLQTVGSLQGVAAKYGKDNDAGKAALQTAMANALRQSLTTRGVATAQIDQAVNAFTQNFASLYAAPIGKMGGGKLPGTRPGSGTPTAPNPSATPRAPRPSATPSAAPTN